MNATPGATVERPDTRTPCTPQELVDALVAVWPSELGGIPTLEAACILAAQWALETGSGASMVQYNIGNVKCPNLAAGDYTYFTTWEDLPAKQARAALAASALCEPRFPPLADDPAKDPPTISVLFHPRHPTCRFRAFGTLQEGARFYLHQMWSRWTAAWHFVIAGDPQGFADGLHAQGYFTAPVATYASDVAHYFNIYMKTLKVPPQPDPLAKTDPAGPIMPMT